MRDLAAWMRSRVLTARIALLCALVVAAVLAAPPGVPPIFAGAMAVVLLLQFRLWDDLADRKHDRARAPERVLARVAGVGAFVALLLVSIVAMAAVLAVRSGWPTAGAYAVLVVLFALLYAMTRPASRLRAAATLLKYPAFVLLLAAAPGSSRAVAVAMALYAVLAVHEWRDARVAEAS